jgi:UDP-N-acetylmuramoyl-tripeptide--D-alanyl-D-alanine ligase
MLPSALSQIASSVQGIATGDATISGIAIDSRKVAVGDLFVALQAERDGHDFIRNASEMGASGALVSKSTDLLPSIRVDNTEHALTNLAREIRNSYDGLVFALTGSQGKTSTRGFLASILEKMAMDQGENEILVTQGNLNNQLGVPLTMARLRPHHPFALFELGASAVGDIDHLTSIVRPRISALLNARAAHLEGFGSIDGVVQGKGEIIDHTALDGMVILNQDEPSFGQWRTRAQSREIISFGQNNADVTWSARSAQDLTLSYQDRVIHARLATLGTHFMENAAAASAMAIAAGANDDHIRLGLEEASIEPGRMTPIALPNCLLVDDTYNASPEAVRAAIDWLSSQSGVRILVMGGLSELGQSADSEMQALGQYARAKGLDRVVTTGTAQSIAEGFGSNALYFQAHDEVSDYLMQQAGDADVVLVKGSRSAQMDRVIRALKQQGGL